MQEYRNINDLGNVTVAQGKTPKENAVNVQSSAGLDLRRVSPERVSIFGEDVQQRNVTSSMKKPTGTSLAQAGLSHVSFRPFNDSFNQEGDPQSESSISFKKATRFNVEGATVASSPKKTIPVEYLSSSDLYLNGDQSQVMHFPKSTFRVLTTEMDSDERLSLLPPSVRNRLLEYRYPIPSS